MNFLYKLEKIHIFDRTIAKILFILVTLLISIPYIGDKIDFLVKAMIVYGFIILGYELITGKLIDIIRSTKTALLLGGFTLSYVITILINRTHIWGGMRSVCFMVLLFALFFLFPSKISKSEIIKEIKIVSAAIIIFTFICSFISFITFVFSISGSYLTNAGTDRTYYGLFDSRLWGLYNPNNSATYTNISIVLSLPFIFSYKKKRIRLPLLFNIFIQFSVLILTGSRAGLYTLAVATAFCAFFLVIYKFKNFTIKTALISVFSAALSLVLFFTSGYFLKEGLAYLPSITNYISTVISTENESKLPDDSGADNNTPDKAPENQAPEINKIDLNRPDSVNSPNSEMFSNRMEIWRASLIEFLEQPIFGVGRANVAERASEHLRDSSWLYHFKRGNTHNIYLCVLVSSGIIGFLLIGSFAGIIMIRSIKTLSKTYKKVNLWFFFSFVICLMFFANEFVESRILYKTSIFGVIFWIYCGYLYRLSKLERIENASSLSEEASSLDSER